MRIAVSGASGLVGSQLVPTLEQEGHDVLRLVRGQPQDKHEVLWDPETGRFQAERLEATDAVVHLAGEPIDQRWSEPVKQRIRASRVQGTELLVAGLLDLEEPPDVLISASAVGYYGDRGDQELTEEAPPGDNWVAEVCRLWEGATVPAAQAGLRVVNLRWGIILSPEGGALAKMLLPFKLALGGRISSGEQWYSWITRRDAVGVIEHALAEQALQGPVNAGSPNPVRNRAFTKALGGALSRPTPFVIPAFSMRMLYGQMADELLLASARMVPEKLEETGYTFQDPEVEPALTEMLA